MIALPLHELHATLGARFTEVRGAEVVADYGDGHAEHAALRETAGVVDLSFRGRLCLLGADRVRLLNGQVTNDVARLKTGEGCYAALVTAKGRMQSDLNIYALPNELLLDFEPGLTTALQQRFEQFIIADDVQVVDVSPHYGLFRVQGPRAAEVVTQLGLFAALPEAELAFTAASDPTLGELYLMNQAPLNRRDEFHESPFSATGPDGDSRSSSLQGQVHGKGPAFDLFVPTDALAAVFDKLVAAAKSVGGRTCGFTALEWARIEAGIPRFGVDLDESNLAPEGGDAFVARAISYTKGCYIGQEVIARIRTYGQVAKSLRGLRLADDLPSLPAKGDKLFKDGREVGHVTSAIHSPAFHANLALGLVRKECNASGTELRLRSGSGESAARVVELPFRD